MFWNDFVLNRTLAGNAQTVDILDADVSDDIRKGLTVVRLIIDVTAVLATAGPGGRLSLGIFVGETEAIAASAVPNPSDVGEDPGWLWRTVGQGVFSSLANDMAQVRRFNIDLKARRRYRGEDTNLTLVMDFSTSNESVNVDGVIRQLLMRA